MDFKEELLLNLPGIKVENITSRNPVVAWVRSVRKVQCPSCRSECFYRNGSRIRTVRHANSCRMKVQLILLCQKYRCRDCGNYFSDRFEGIRPRLRYTEPFRNDICESHHLGITAVDLQRRYGLGHSSVSRWYNGNYLWQFNQHLQNAQCPRVLGIDEHFFTRKLGYVTTLCNLERHKVFDLVLGHTEAALAGYLRRLPGRLRVKVVVMDLCSRYRSIVRKYFPNAKIVADRFHVIRMVGQHFMNTWKILDEQGRNNRGLMSLMRRKQQNLKPEQAIRLQAYLNQHPSLEAIYRFKQELCQLLNLKGQTQRACRPHIRKLLEMIACLKRENLAPLRTMAGTLTQWLEEIVRMWRFSKSNGITEGFHNKLKMMVRRAYGFKNFQNYRMKARVMCS